MDLKPLEKKVLRFLIDFGFPTKLSGYHYLKDGMLFVLENTITPSNKILFSHLADKFNTDPDNIERCVRTLVDKHWRALGDEGLFDERPTNREFIIKCAEYVSYVSPKRSVYDILGQRLWYN